MKYILFMCLITYDSSSVYGDGPGGTHNLELDNAADYLNISLTVLAAENGPIYKAAKIHFGTISGLKTNINADLKDQRGKIKTCNIKLIFQFHLEKNAEVTLECPGERKLVKSSKYTSEQSSDEDYDLPDDSVIGNYGDDASY